MEPLPRVVDRVAASDPDKTFASIPLSTSPRDGYRTITFQNLSSAVNRMSRWIESNLEPTSPGTTIAYLGMNDLRYIIIILAAIKTAHTILLPSLRNSLDGHRSLLAKTQCGLVLHSQDAAALVNTLPDNHTRLHSHQVPGLDELLEAGSDLDASHFHGKESDLVHDPMIIIHTSG